ncbi:DNA polymerase delta, subunit 4-domain-containing protein [Pilaira anomala]|nr:DNA polymerase delta, subunit 4-domain-containing protein [Pilaira anomala]
MAPKTQTSLNIPKTRRHTKQEFKTKSIDDDSVLKIGSVKQELKTRVHEERLLDETDKMLRHFDLDYTYGPCVGLSRIDRWDRADALGLSPPQSVRNSLLKDKTKFYQENVFSQFRSI